MFGHSVQEIERSHHHVVILETATSGAVVTFALLAVLVLLVYRTPGGVATAALFSTFALYSSISSSFIGDRDLRALVVRRRIAFWTLERIYPAETIDVVFVCRYRKGNGLRVRLRSGRCKTLTTCVDWLYELESVAGALNHFLYTPHRGKQARV
jgi:hypothetical protein